MASNDYSSKACKLAVVSWKRAAPELARIRDQEISQTDTAHAIQILSDLFEMAVKQPMRMESGLVEQQRWFKRFRGR